MLGWKLVVSLPAILLVALLAERRLGVQRSLAASALAGVAGWPAALALSLAIANGDPGAPGLWTAGVGVRGSALWRPELNGVGAV